MRNSLKVLVIDEEFPYPLNTGKRIRSFNLTNQLAKHTSVSYLAYGEKNSESAKYLATHNITPYAVKQVDLRQHGIKFYFKLLFNILSPFPYIVSSHHSHRFARKLKQLLDQHHFDIIIVEWSPYALFVKSITGCRKVIVAHNIESDIWERYQKNEKNYFKYLYIKLQYLKLKRFESRAFNWADGATAVSHNDASFIDNLGLQYKTAVIENGVDTEYFHPMDGDIDEATLVFTGSMDWRPNQDAAVYFAQQIFPLLKQEIADLKVVFVGRNPPRHIVDLGTQTGIIFTGIVDDVRQYIAKGSLYIVPLRIGGGSRLKILEAMAMRKPIVSTSIGAEGLEITDGENILLADTPEEFCQLCLKALRDSHLSEKIAKNGYDLVHEKYKWTKITKKLQRYLNSL